MLDDEKRGEMGVAGRCEKGRRLKASCALSDFSNLASPLFSSSSIPLLQSASSS